MRYAGTHSSEHNPLRSVPALQAGACPDAALLMLCGELRVLQGKWQALWSFTSEDWGLDAPPITVADHEWLAFNDNVWPAVHISGQTPRHPDDLPGALLDFHPTTAEGIRAKAAAVLAMEDAAGYGGDCRNDCCDLTHSVLVDMAGATRMLLGEDAERIAAVVGA